MFTESIYWKKPQSLATQYIARDHEVCNLYDFHYLDDHAWETRALWLHEQSTQRAPRNQLVQALTTYNERIGNSIRAMEHIQQLSSEQAYVVVGGQQAGLMGGPLFTLYKAITLIQLAEQASKRLARHVIPVFWIAGEDHDFEEVNHFYYLNSRLVIDKLKMNKPRKQMTAISQLPVSAAQWEEVVDHVDRIMADSIHKRKLMERLRSRVIRDSLTLTDHFAKMMAMIFEPYGLVLVDADDSELRHIESSMWQKLIKQNKPLSESFNYAKQFSEQLGYPAQTQFDEHYTHIFLYHENQRKLLLRQGDTFVDKKATVKLTLEQLLEIAQSTPQRLSNGVLSRPLMQEYVFPVLATVLGHAEIAYWGLTKSAFELMNMRMPILVPRIEVTLVEPRVKKLLSQYDWTVQDVVTGVYRTSNTMTALPTNPLLEQLAELKAQFTTQHQSIVSQLNESHPELVQLGQDNLILIQKQIDYLSHKVKQADEHKQDSIYQQLACIEHSLVPFAKPQERVYNMLYYLNQYGDTWIHHMIQRTFAYDSMHQIYELTGGSQ
jgi:bacillithiol biosynthesis cysteine-adding enzyme BshC